MPRHVIRGGVAAMAALAAVLFLTGAKPSVFNPNALWNIVNGECVPNQEQHGDPKPCAEVNLKDGVDHGYAVLKDLNGPTQYLLIPTARIVGIESPELQAPGATNYFAAAWDEQRFVEKALGHELPRDNVGLAVNSVLSRSQSQLHIHIDCMRPDVRSALARLRSSIGDTWAALDEPVGGHPYWAMRVMGSTLDGHNPFKLLADGIPRAREHMKMRTLVVVGMTFDGGAPGFVLLTDRINPLLLDIAAGARLEDHTCGAGH
ncbi:MAG: CDP-diacylglycerol diphosphatase [Xanthobacteraceae bacterium]